MLSPNPVHLVKDLLGLLCQKGCARRLAVLTRTKKGPCTATTLSRQVDLLVLLWITDDCFGLATVRHDTCLFQHPTSHHDDSCIAPTQVFLRAVCHSVLSDPGNEVLVHDVRVHPASRLLIDQW